VLNAYGFARSIRMRSVINNHQNCS
jgi:hypothetical protein